MKPLKAGQLATLINKDRRIGCVIRVAKKASSGSCSVCEECKKSNYEAHAYTDFCLMRLLDKSCAQTIPSMILYPKVITFFKVILGTEQIKDDSI